MASTKVGKFTVNISTGAQAITGVGFQPKLVFFWGHELANNSGNELRRAFGCATSSTARWCTSTGVRCSTSPVQQQHFYTNRCLAWDVAPTGAARVALDFTSMDADGFTVNVVTALTVDIYYFAVGGTDVSAKVGTFNSSTTSGATQSVTGVGFQPSLVLFSRDATNTTTTSQNESHWAVGMATSTSARATTGFYCEGNNPSPVHSFQRTDKVAAMISSSAFNQTADISSFDADGFSLSWDLAPATAAIYGYVALGGSAVYNVFNFSGRTTNGLQAVTGVGFKPQAIVMFSNGQSASNSLIRTGDHLLTGAATATVTGSTCHWIPSSSSSTTMPLQGFSDEAVYIKRDETGVTNLVSVGYWSSFDTDGFTLNWTSTDGVANHIVGFAIRENTSATTVPVSGVFGAGAVGSTTVVAKAGVTITGLAATSALGSVTVSTAIRTLVSASGVQANTAVGALTVTGTASVTPSGVAATAFVGPVTIPVPVVRGIPISLPAMIMAPARGVHVELPLFGVMPSFTPDHTNTAADPSQPTRWTNVLPP
jgi:hypothetical protein